MTDRSAWREAPRFFLTREDCTGESATLRGDDAHHAAHVLRLAPDDPIVLLDGSGDECYGLVRHVVRARSGPEVRISLVARERAEVEPPFPVHLVQGLPKGDKLELVLQKGTELGVTGFWPVFTERAVVSYTPERLENRHARWLRIVTEAAKQCRRAIVPEVARPVGLLDAVRTLRQGANDVIVLWEEERQERLSSVLRRKVAAGFPAVKGAGIALVVGPEGGLTPEEVADLGALGAERATIGPRILRTETAGIVVPALALYELELAR